MPSTDPLQLIEEAESKLYHDDDPEGCIALCDLALPLLEGSDARADVLLLKVEAQVSLDDNGDDALATLAELNKLDLTDAGLLCDIGQLYWALEHDVEAESAFNKALEIDPEMADAHHGVGLVCEGRDDDAGMVKAWLRARELDLAAPLPDFHLTAEEFQAAAEEALAELPESIREKLTNVPMLIADMPSPELVEDGLDPRLLGLFDGIPLDEKTGDELPTIDTILLFQLNLERACEDREELLEEIRITVLHETAHFFGLDDADLAELGLD